MDEFGVGGGGALFLLVFVLYLPMWWAQYIWDDDLVLTLNPVIVGPKGFADIWTSSSADICPLTISTFWLEHSIWDLAPLPYHLVNVALHGGCAVLLWRVLLMLRIPGAWIGAALWAMHPVMVESVAWVAELKNTESGIFYLFSILFFLRTLPLIAGFDQKRVNWNYGLCLVMAALAIACKSSTVVLPAVLCLMAWWVERGWRWIHAARVSPMLALGAAAAALSIWTQRIAGSEDADMYRSWPMKIVEAAGVVWFYLGKLIWPHPLITLYPKWEMNLSNGAVYFPLVALVLLLTALWWWRNSWARPWFFAMGYFVIVLLPVVGIVNMKFFFYTMVADHFQYLAAMGPLALLGAGLWQLGALAGTWVRVVAAGLVLAGLSVVSFIQEQHYYNEQVLWDHVLAYDPTCAVGYNNEGMLLVKANKIPASVPYFEKALGVDPNYENAETNLGSAYYSMGDADRSIGHFQNAIKLKPNDAHALANLAVALTKKDRAAEAIPLFEKAVTLVPDDGQIWYGFGLSYVQLNQLDKAIGAFQHAIKFDPRQSNFHNNCGAALYHAGRSVEALEQFQEAVRLDPSNQDAQHNADILSKALQGGGHP